MLLGGVLMTLPKFKFDKVMLINSSYIVLGASFLLPAFCLLKAFTYFQVFHSSAVLPGRYSGSLYSAYTDKYRSRCSGPGLFPSTEA